MRFKGKTQIFSFLYQILVLSTLTFSSEGTEELTAIEPGQVIEERISKIENLIK